MSSRTQRGISFLAPGLASARHACVLDTPQVRPCRLRRAIHGAYGRSHRHGTPTHPGGERFVAAMKCPPRAVALSLSATTRACCCFSASRPTRARQVGAPVRCATVRAMDGAYEPTWTYSRRVALRTGVRLRQPARARTPRAQCYFPAGTPISCSNCGAGSTTVITQRM